VAQARQHDKPVDKVSYVQGFEPWGWVIGSGIYVDDLYRRSGATCPALLAWVLGGIVAAMLDAAGGLPVPELLPRDGRRPGESRATCAP
jgi:hypothetical protein